MTIKPSISLIVTIDFKDSVEEFIKPFYDPAIGKPEYQIIVSENIGWNIFKWRNKKVTTSSGCVIEIIRLFRSNRAKQRNAAIKKAKSDLLLLYAGDFVPFPETIPQHIKFHQEHPDKKEVAVGPGIFIREKRTPFMLWLEDTGNIFGLPFLDYFATEKIDFFYGANTSIKKAFIEEVGLFDERFQFDTSDDHDISIRLHKHGMQTYIVPKASAVHEHDVTLPDRLMLLRMAGKSTVIMDKKYPDVSTWSSLRTIDLNELKRSANDNINKYYETNELQFLHQYFEKISNHAFSSSYQEELRKQKMIY